MRIMSSGSKQQLKQSSEGHVAGGQGKGHAVTGYCVPRWKIVHLCIPPIDSSHVDSSPVDKSSPAPPPVDRSSMFSKLHATSITAESHTVHALSS